MTDVSIPGLRYAPDVVTTVEECALVAMLETIDLPFRTSEGRTMICWGAPFRDARWSIGPVAPIPDAVMALASRVFAPHVVPPLSALQVLVTRYDPGGGIEKHRDALVFAEPIVGLSLGADATMRFEREGHEAIDVLVRRRSIYALSGEARSEWTHCIPKTDAVRWSITFRAVTGGGA